MGRKIIDFSLEENEYVSQISTMNHMAKQSITVAATFTLIIGEKLLGSSFFKGYLGESDSLDLYVFLQFSSNNRASNFNAYTKNFIDLIDIDSHQELEVA